MLGAWFRPIAASEMAHGRYLQRPRQAQPHLVVIVIVATRPQHTTSAGQNLSLSITSSIYRTFDMTSSKGKPTDPELREKIKNSTLII